MLVTSPPGRIPSFVRPLGGPASQTLYRLLGWGLLNLVFARALFAEPALVFSADVWIFHLLGVLAAGLVVLGARPALLLVLGAVLALVTALLFVEELRTRAYGPLFVLLRPTDEEWLLYAVLSIGGLALGALARAGAGERADERVDWIVRRLFLASVATTLLFAGLHKINADFLDPEVSCLASRQSLRTVWSVPPVLFEWVRPVHIVALELTAAVLLVVRPPVGMLATVLVLAPFGHIGATAFAGLVAYCSFAAVPPARHGAIVAGLRRARWFLAGALVLAAAVSFVLYDGPRAWVPSLLFQLGLGALIVCGVLAVRSRAEEPAIEVPLRLRIALALVVALLLVNGARPYLGLGFRYGFAMYSNLRADDARWNSLLFPRALRVTSHDGFVRVRRVRTFDLRSGEPIEAPRVRIAEGLYAPPALRDRVRHALAQGVSPIFDFEHAGEHHRFDGISGVRELYERLDQLPENLLWQAYLPEHGPQPCLH